MVEMKNKKINIHHVLGFTPLGSELQQLSYEMKNDEKVEKKIIYRMGRGVGLVVTYSRLKG